MATAHPASSEAGPQPESNKKPKSQPEKHVDVGTELESASPVAASPLVSDAISRGKRKKPVEPEPEAAAEGDSGGRNAPLVIAGVDEAEESSASHLSGSSAAAIQTVDAKFHRLLATVHENRPADDLEIIRKAWAFCLLQHEGQKRASGEPYIIHPLEVGQVLAELKMDSTAIAAGLLHDAVEDTDVTSAEIAKRFGDQVAHIVEGVTKLEKIKFANREDHQAENIRKMLLAMVTDVRVVIIKLADRLHNMRTLEHLNPEKQQKIARETLDIYAPLAHRLGMQVLRARADEREREYPFGVVFRLFEARFARATGPEHDQLFRGWARLARPLLSATDQAVPNVATADEFGLIRGLYWCVLNLCEEQPVALLVDDLQWVDEQSLRFLAHLVDRLVHEGTVRRHDQQLNLGRQRGDVIGHDLRVLSRLELRDRFFDSANQVEVLLR